MYDRHTVILNKNWPWCTIRFTGDPSETDFHNSYNLHLLNISLNMYAPLKPHDISVPNYVKEYQSASDRNWALLQEENYAAYYHEDDYSSFVEVVSEKPGFPQGTHSCSSKASSMVSVPPTTDFQPNYPMLDVDQTQDPIPGMVFSPIAFSEPEPVLENEVATPVTTGPTTMMSTSSELDSTNVNTDQPMMNIVNMLNLTSSNDLKFNNTSVTSPLTMSQPQSIQENVTMAL